MMDGIKWTAFFVSAVAVLLSGTLPSGWCAERPEVHELRYYRQVEPGKPKLIECDVAVYGGTPAGVTAAIQAARMGQNAVLLSFNRHVGGMTSGGLTATDVGNKDSIGGMAQEFYTRIGRLRDYRPSEAESLFLKMLDEAGVPVLFERCLESAVIKDGRLVSATMETGETVEAAVFIDATYEGDLLAAAKVSYCVGREPAGAYGESLGGKWQEISYKNVYQFCRLPLSPYLKADDPESGLLPEISSEPPGNAGEGDFKVQAYNFRMHLTNQAEKIPFPKPRGYDPGRYALLARFLNADPRLRWTLNYTTAPMTDGPVQMRIGDSNNAGSFSSDYIGGNYRWPDGTYDPGAFAELPPPRRGLPMPFRELYAIRERIFQDHVTYQQGLMYFLANDPQVPETLRDRVNRFGLDPQEFQKTGFWPHQLYVREGRRMVSEYVVTQANCESKRTANDSIGLASYPMDSHFCQRVVVEEKGKTTVRNDGNFGHRCPKPYPISYRSIIPKKEECINLLVPVCLSASHAAYGSIRMEPVFMILGQSAGTAAALAIDERTAIQDLTYEKLREKLVENGQRLSYPPSNAFALKTLDGVVVDDEAAAAQGDWIQGTVITPFVGQGYRHDNNANKGASTMNFTAELPSPGRYEVRLAYSSQSNRARHVPVTVHHRDGVRSVAIDQRKKPNIQGCWISLGHFDFDQRARVVVGDEGTDGYVIADAVQFLPVGANPVGRICAGCGLWPG
jgi:hypothetical protein